MIFLVAPATSEDTWQGKMCDPKLAKGSFFPAWKRHSDMPENEVMIRCRDCNAFADEFRNLYADEFQFWKLLLPPWDLTARCTKSWWVSESKRNRRCDKGRALGHAKWHSPKDRFNQFMKLGLCKSKHSYFLEFALPETSKTPWKWMVGRWNVLLWPGLFVGANC